MSSSQQRMPSYGGQALIEGVLMRGKNSLAAAIRSPQGKIIIQKEKLKGIYKNKFFEIPFIRGLVILWDSLVVGMKYLTISANLQSNDGEQIDGPSLYIAVVLAIGFAIAFFFLLPVLVVSLISKVFPMSPLFLNIAEGIVRLLFIILYLWLISFIKDVQRVFSYHGAEHKTINAYEDHADLDVKSVMRYSVEHPRCGTSFLLTLVVISIILFSFSGNMPVILKIISRIVAVPVLAMMSYEIIRWMGIHFDNPIVRFLSIPNMELQKLTTREPSPEMVEVALAAFNSLLEIDKS